MSSIYTIEVTDATSQVNTITVEDSSNISVVVVGQQGPEGPNAILGRSVVDATASTAGSLIVYDHGNTQWVDSQSSAAQSLTAKLYNLAFTSGGATVTGVLDEDDMSSNSATKLVTQQSLKAYVDSQVTAQDLDITDGSTTIAIDLDSETLTFTGGTGLDSTASGNTVTFAIDSTVATLTGTQTLTNKTLTSPAINTPTITSGVVATSLDLNGQGLIIDADADTKLVASADDTVDLSFAGATSSPTQFTHGSISLKNGGTQSRIDFYCEVSNAHYARLQAAAHSAFSGNVTITLPTTTGNLVGTGDSGTVTNTMLAGSIANAKLANSSITVTDGSSSTATALGGTITFSAGEGIDVGESSGTITVSAEDATSSNKGVASFDSTDFTVSSGAVTVNAERVQDIVGAMFSSNTESGISVTYQDGDGTIDLDVGDSTITLSGDVTGSGTITNLGDVTISTTIAANSIALGTDTTGNYVTDITAGEGIDVSGGGSETATVTVSAEDATSSNKGIASFDSTDFSVSSGAVTVNAERIQDIVGAMVSSNTESGISVTYEDGDGTLDFNVGDPDIAITGDVTGSATMTNLANVSISSTAAAAQTNITSILATDLKIGEDDQTKIDFETADEIHFYASNAEQVYVADGIFSPQTDSDVDLGADAVRWKNAFIDAITTTGNITVGGNLTVSGTTTTTNTTEVTVSDPVFTIGGDSAPSSDDNKDRGIQFRWHNGSAAKIGFFGYDDSTGYFSFRPDATNSSEVFSGTLGDFQATNFRGALVGNASTATALATARTIGGTSFDGTGDIVPATITVADTTDTTCSVALFESATGNLAPKTDGGLTYNASTGTLTATGVVGTNVTANTAFVPDANDGATLGTSSLGFADAFLADGSTIQFGNDQDVTLTHVADTGLLLNSTMQLQFNDASQNITAPNATTLDINATDEIELNATLVDVNANLDVSGTYTGAGLMTTGGNIVIPDAGNIGSASDTDALAIASNGVVTFSQAPTFPAGSISLAALDIDGGTAIGEAVVDADLFIVDNGAGGTNRKVAASVIKTYVNAASSSAADDITAGDAAVNITTSSGNITIDAAASNTDIIFKGTDGSSDITMLTLDGSEAGEAIFNAGIVIADAANIGSASDKDALAIASDGVVTFSQAPVFPDGSINLADLDIDGGTEIGAAIVDADLFIIDDGAGGTNRKVLASRIKTYAQQGVSSAADDITAGDAAVNLTTSSGNITIDAAANNTNIIFKGTDDTSDITMLTLNGSDAGAATFNHDVKLGSDAAILGFGADNDVTLTHVADTGLLLNGTSQLQFNDASQNITAPSATVLDINATDEVEINATLADVNANLDVSGTYTGGGLMTTGGNIVIPDGGNIGSASDTDAIAIAANGVVTFSQSPVFPDGGVPLDDLDIDGGTDIGAALVDADLFIVDDGAGGTNRKTAASRIKTYVGASAGAFSIANLDIDGGTDIGADIVDADLFVIDDGAGGTNRKVAASRIKTYVTGDNTLITYKYTATAGQTTFTGSDGTNTLAYTTGNLFVTLNGLTLENGTDYTATNGTSVVLTDAATVGDELNIYAFGTFNAANVTAANGDFSVGDDLTLASDGAIINMGADSDVTLTHVADTGLLLNSTMQLQFNDASQNINAPSATVLDINATDEIELNATLVDVNANLDVSGTYTGGGLMTTGGNIVIPDSGTIGSASDTDAIQINSAGEIGIGASAITSATVYVYNNEESHQAIDIKQDNASSATQVVNISNDGTGYGFYNVNSNGSGTYTQSSRGTAGYYVQNGAVAANYAIYAQATSNYGIFARTLSTSHGGLIAYDDAAACYGILGYSPSTTLYSLYGNGSTYVSGSYTGSDSRLKDIQSRITTSDGILAKINQLKPTYYKWKSDSDQGQKDNSEQIGLIAQEVESVFSHIVKEAPVPDLSESPPDADGKVEKRDKTLNEELGDTKFITYEKLTVYLTAALQEASAKIDALETRIAALESS